MSYLPLCRPAPLALAILLAYALPADREHRFRAGADFGNNFNPAANKFSLLDTLTLINSRRVVDDPTASNG